VGRLVQRRGLDHPGNRERAEATRTGKASSREGGALPTRPTPSSVRVVSSSRTDEGRGNTSLRRCDGPIPCFAHHRRGCPSAWRNTAPRTESAEEACMKSGVRRGVVCTLNHLKVVTYGITLPSWTSIMPPRTPALKRILRRLTHVHRLHRTRHPGESACRSSAARA